MKVNRSIAESSNSIQALEGPNTELQLPFSFKEEDFKSNFTNDDIVIVKQALVKAFMKETDIE